jgi:hypothetical protein
MNIIEQTLEQFEMAYEDIDLDEYYCCSGRECACTGMTVKESMQDFLKQAMLEAMETVLEEVRIPIRGARVESYGELERYREWESMREYQRQILTDIINKYKQ